MEEQGIIAKKDLIIEKILREKYQVEEENKVLKGKVYDLTFQLEQLRKCLFGSRSERKSPTQIPNQPLLDFGGLEVEETPEEKKQTITYQRKKRKEKIKPVRKELPPHLLRIDKIIKPAGDLSLMTKIGELISEELEYKEPELYVNRFIREKYIYTSEKKALKSKVLIGELPSRPIEKGIPGPKLLSKLVVSKYADHLPIYRQTQIFKRNGVELPPSTVYGWISAAANLLEVLYDELRKLILGLDYTQLDESPVKVLNHDGKGGIHRGWFWVYYSPLIRQVFFDYRKGRDREGPEELLKDYKGYLQTDGYAVYDRFEKEKNITLLGCIAHARRKFVEAEKQDPDRAGHVIKEMQKLYFLEKTMREENWSSSQIQAEREKTALPILVGLKKWMIETYQKVTPKSTIGKAIHYSLRRWEKLMVYVLDGKLQIDNNLVENQIRPVALGRKNYLFAGSHNGAKAAAIFYSLLGSCRHNNVNPSIYFSTVFARINDTKISKLISLLPGSIDL